MKFNVHLLVASIFIALLFFNSTKVSAQVGINNPLPDSSAVLDLSGGANINKGVLLPTTGDPNLVSNPAHGLLVFDTLDNEFYFRNDNSSSWQSLNRLKSNYNQNSYLMDSLAIGKTTPGSQLDVNGKISADSVSATEINATSVTAGSVNATGAIMEAGAQLVPRGVIVMWSGTAATVPAGWALCTGVTTTWDGVTSTTPDLRGRFVIGYDPIFTSSYNNPGNLSTGGSAPGLTGGSESVTLTASQAPLRSHNHTVTSTGATTTTGGHRHAILTAEGTGTGECAKGFNIGGSGGANHRYTSAGTSSGLNNNATGCAGAAVDGTHNHNVTVSGTTSTAAISVVAPHENRPPYYVLAFIMKL